VPIALRFEVNEQLLGCAGPLGYWKEETVIMDDETGSTDCVNVSVSIGANETNATSSDCSDDSSSMDSSDSNDDNTTKPTKTPRATGQREEALKRARAWNTITMGKWCAEPRHLSALMAQIGAAFGLTFEQQRPDAGEYIEVLWENVRQGALAHFAPVPKWPSSERPYDYASIMHAHSRAYAQLTTSPTVRALGANESEREARQLAMDGAKFDLSPWDRYQLVRAYCPANWPYSSSDDSGSGSGEEGVGGPNEGEGGTYNSAPGPVGNASSSPSPPLSLTPSPSVAPYSPSPSPPAEQGDGDGSALLPTDAPLPSCPRGYAFNPETRACEDFCSAARDCRECLSLSPDGALDAISSSTVPPFGLPVFHVHLSQIECVYCLSRRAGETGCRPAGLVAVEEDEYVETELVAVSPYTDSSDGNENDLAVDFYEDVCQSVDYLQPFEKTFNHCEVTVLEWREGNDASPSLLRGGPACPRQIFLTLFLIFCVWAWA
jgi:hypothetical protein